MQLVTWCLADEPIHFALLMPITCAQSDVDSAYGSWDGGKRIAGAAALAVERVNTDKTLLPGRRLEYSWEDSACSAPHGLAAMGKLLGEASRARRAVDVVIGPGCSAACEVTSYLARGQNLAQVSWGTTSPSFSSNEKFPLVSLAHPSSQMMP